jgi:hypothetical protein
MKSWNLLAVWAVLALGCNSSPHYDGLSFELQSSPPQPASFESDRIEVPAGVAVKVKVKPLSRGEHYDADALLILRPNNAERLAVYDTMEDHAFVFVGLREGETCLRVEIDREEQECLEVRVLPAE